MKQCKTKVVTVLLAAILGLSALLGFAGANRNTASAAVGEEEPVKIGISVPNTDFFGRMVDYLVNEYGKEADWITTFMLDAPQQASELEGMIGTCQILIVAPIDADAIADVLWEVARAGIFIIVIGRPNQNYPNFGIIYETQDYYALGKNHAKSIAAETLTPDIANFVVFYYVDEDGVDYLNGFKKGLQLYGLTGNVHEYILGDRDPKYVPGYNPDYYSVTFYIQEWIRDHDSAERNEMVTYDGSVASVILQTYYNENYQTALPGEGTGIRALPNSLIEEDPAKKFAEATSGSINSALDGASFSGDVKYVSFIQGISEYVI